MGTRTGSTRSSLFLSSLVMRTETHIEQHQTGWLTMEPIEGRSEHTLRLELSVVGDPAAIAAVVNGGDTGILALIRLMYFLGWKSKRRKAKG